MDNKIDRQPTQRRLYDHTRGMPQSAQSILGYNSVDHSSKKSACDEGGNGIPKWHAVNAASTRKNLALAEHFYKNWMARFCSPHPPLPPPPASTFFSPVFKYGNAHVPTMSTWKGNIVASLLAYLTTVFNCIIV
jgi:hypothetical protein